MFLVILEGFLEAWSSLPFRDLDGRLLSALFTLTEIISRAHLLSFFLEILVCHREDGEPGKPREQHGAHGQPPGPTPAVTAPVSIAAQLPCLAPHLLFRDKLHLPENTTVQPEECQNSILLSMSYFGQATCF